MYASHKCEHTCIDMPDGSPHSLGHIRSMPAGPALSRQRSEASLVVHNHMYGTTHCVPCKQLEDQASICTVSYERSATLLRYSNLPLQLAFCCASWEHQDDNQLRMAAPMAQMCLQASLAAAAVLDSCLPLAVYPAVHVQTHCVHEVPM